MFEKTYKNNLFILNLFFNFYIIFFNFFYTSFKFLGYVNSHKNTTRKKKCLGYINSQKNNREEKNYFFIFVFIIENEKESKI